MGIVIQASKEFWWKRATLPNYEVGRAAQLVDLHPSTLTRWQNSAYVIPQRERGKGVSYLQLIEAAVVAKMRQAKIKLYKIRDTREFCSDRLGSEYPFATHKFRTDGVDLLLDFDKVFVGNNEGKIVVASRGGQLAWSSMFKEMLKAFEYEDDIVTKWRVAGLRNPIIIDPRVGFGAPTISGIPTETIYDKWNSGDDAEDLMEDYSLSRKLVREAINFEGRLRNEAFEINR